jgi:hypothetical protein
VIELPNETLTLDEIVHKAAAICMREEDLVKTNGVYLGEALILFNQFKDAINSAYRSIAREKYHLYHEEMVTLDADKCFDPGSLSKQVYQIIDIQTATGARVNDDDGPNNKVKCSDFNEGDKVKACYWYVPLKMAALTDVPEIPATVADPMIYAYFAAFDYFLRFDDGKSAYWLNLYNDGIGNIKPNRTAHNNRLKKWR